MNSGGGISVYVEMVDNKDMTKGSEAGTPGDQRERMQPKLQAVTKK